jgi:hypothetical protein
VLACSKRPLLALIGAVLAFAGRARAQDVSVEGVRPALGQKAPRLSYARGPAECLSEDGFRDEVAIALHGADLFDESAPDVLRVWFEKVPGGYRGTLEYTDADGRKEPPKPQSYYNCEILGRMLGTSASYYLRRRSGTAAPDVPPPAAPPQVPPTAPPAAEPLRCSLCVPSQPALPRSRCEPPPDDMDVTIGLTGFALMTAFYTANVGPGVGLMADVRGELLSFGLELRGIFPGRVYANEPIYPDDPTKQTRVVELDVSQVSAAAVPCVRWKYFVGCGVAQLGATMLKDTVQMSTVTTFLFGPRLGFEVPITERFAIFGFGEALFIGQGAGVRYDIDNDAPAANTRWGQSIASGFFGLGLTTTFK